MQLKVVILRSVADTLHYQVNSRPNYHSVATIECLLPPTPPSWCMVQSMVYCVMCSMLHSVTLCDAMRLQLSGSLSLYTTFDTQGYVLLMRVPIYKLIWLNRSIELNRYVPTLTCSPNQKLLVGFKL